MALLSRSPETACEGSSGISALSIAMDVSKVRIRFFITLSPFVALEKQQTHEFLNKFRDSFYCPMPTIAGTSLVMKGILGCLKKNV